MIVGTIGLILLVLCYMVLNTKYSAWFLPIDILGSFFLSWHAIIIKDGTFIFVNIFILIMLSVKQYNGGFK